MILTILTVVAVATLVASLWKYILAFLNGLVRDLLERIFGVEHCGWYVNFLQWADRQMAVPHRIVKMQWRKFRDTVLKVQSKFVDNEDGTYTKRTDSLVRTSPTSGRRVVYEETIDWSCLPDSVRGEMLRLRTKEAELDDRIVTEERIRQRAEEEGLVLSA
jgi:hypothetical protein